MGLDRFPHPETPDEARATLQPALEYYQREQQLGAQATSFRFGYAYALYVSSLAGGGDPAERRVALATAAKLLDSTPTEAKNLSDLRELAGQIATARAAKQG